MQKQHAKASFCIFVRLVKTKINGKNSVKKLKDKVFSFSTHLKKALLKIINIFFKKKSISSSKGNGSASATKTTNNKLHEAQHAKALFMHNLSLLRRLELFERSNFFNEQYSVKMDSQTANASIKAPKNGANKPSLWIASLENEIQPRSPRSPLSPLSPRSFRTYNKKNNPQNTLWKNRQAKQKLAAHSRKKIRANPSSNQKPNSNQLNSNN